MNTIMLGEDLKKNLLIVMEDLQPMQQVEVLDFALFLRERQLVWEWDAISDSQAEALKAEFNTEDSQFAEIAIVDYLPLLKREDEA